MIISSRVKYCNLVKGRKSYVVIGIDVTTVYSSTVVEKRYEDFEIFQKTLSYFWNQKYEGGILLDLIPRLPCYSSNLTYMDMEFSSYIVKLVQLLQNASFHKYHPWIKFINEFFSIKAITKKEESTASLIQKYFKIYMKLKKLKKLTG